MEGTNVNRCAIEGRAPPAPKRFSMRSAATVAGPFFILPSLAAHDLPSAASTAPAHGTVGTLKSLTIATSMISPVLNVHFWLKSDASAARRCSKTSLVGSTMGTAASLAIRN